MIGDSGVLRNLLGWFRDYDKAREVYEYYVEYWQDADPELQPMVEETRQAILRLGPLQRQ